MNLDIIVAIFASIGYFVFILISKKSKTFESYSVADRSIGLFILFASLSANFIGPGFTLGLTHQGYSTGYMYLFIAGAYGIGKIIEGFFLAPRLREKFTSALSIGDVVAGESSHNSKLLQFLVGLISFGSLIGLSVVMSKAAGEVLNNFLGIPKILGTVIITSIVTGYSVFGGLKSTMMTDTLQFIIFMIILPLLAIVSISNSNFNFAQFSEVARSLTQDGFAKTSTITIISMILTWMCGEMLMPFTVNTVLASKNSTIAKKALLYSGLLMILWLALMLTLGIISKITLNGVANDDQVLLQLGKNFYISGVFGFFTVAIVGVIMSSQDALINCASVVFTQDLINVVRPVNKKRILHYSKIAGIIVGLLSIIFASFIPTIITGLMFFYNIWIPSVLVVAILSIFLKKPSYIAGIITLFVGVLITLLWGLTPWENTLPNIFIGLVSSVFTYFLVYFLTKKRIHV